MPPIDPKDFGSRECLMEKVRGAIESGLPESIANLRPLLRRQASSTAEPHMPEIPPRTPVFSVVILFS